VNFDFLLFDSRGSVQGSRNLFGGAMSLSFAYQFRLERTSFFSKFDITFDLALLGRFLNLLLLVKSVKEDNMLLRRDKSNFTGFFRKTFLHKFSVGEMLLGAAVESR